jgi:general secretion pathway protein A
MYENFYGLKEKPFSLTPDPKFLFLSKEHKGAIDHIIYGMMQKEGFTCLTGDVGTGKTTICRALVETMDEGIQTALILNPLVSEEELLKCILQDFGISYNGSSKKGLIDELNSFLLEQSSMGKSAVLILLC